MCKGNCVKCKKAEFETTDVQVESLGQRSGMFVDDIKIGMTDGDDRNELQPACMRAKPNSGLLTIALEDIEKDSDFGDAVEKGYLSVAVVCAVRAMIKAGYRK